MSWPAPQATPARGSRLAELADARRRARGLGWFSVGLGAAQILAPGALARLIGVGERPRTRSAMFLCGLRELGAGLGLLRGSRQHLWLWARVAGDALDVLLLARAYGARDAEPGRVTAALGAVLGVTALDVATARAMSRQESADSGQGRVARAITVGRPVEQVYAFWSDLPNLALFMSDVESIEALGTGRFRWRMRGKAKQAKQALVAEVEVTDVRPNERIAWRTRAESDLSIRGEVRFRPAPGGRGTEVLLDVQLAVPKLFGRALGVVLENDLRRFKQIMETGEIIRSDASLFAGPHPARPAADDELGQDGSNGRGGAR